MTQKYITYYLLSWTTVKPYVINKDEFRNIVIKKTQLFKLDVRYGGEPEPTVIWKKDDKEIIPDEEER